MLDKHKISIIIPTFNRADIILETLKSIKDQSYGHFECLIIDDHSSDNTQQIVSEFELNDSRFKYAKRPIEKPKGANACRNYGLDKLQGDFVVFFDSDDVMTKNHLEVKINEVLKHNLDFVVTKTKYFNNDELNNRLKKNYQFNTSDISAINYITHKINWLTYDTLIHADIAKSITFNESLASGQEYNYYCKLVLKTTKAHFVPEALTLRRYQENSIRGALLKDQYANNLGYFRVYWATYKEIKDNAPKKGLQFLMFRSFRIAQKIGVKDIDDKLKFRYALIKTFGAKGLFYIMKLYINQLKKRTA